MRVLFVSTGLGTGGAEKQLVRLLGQLSRGGVEAEVVSLGSAGPVSNEIAAEGIPTRHLGLDRPWRLPLAAGELARIAHRIRPDVIQGWMYHGNLAALWAARTLGGQAPVVWGVRQSLYDIRREKMGTQAVIGLSARLSVRPAAIVYNAEVSRAQHEAYGYISARGMVISNGFDSTYWRPDESARRSVRAELGLSADVPLIGLIARYHPMKGHEVFHEAARLLAARYPDVHFLLAGNGVEAKRPPFVRWEETSALTGRIHLLGERADVPRLTAALDIACSSSSWGEAFSNALAEALLCAVPVVATDVGDVCAIVGDAGLVSPAGDAAGLAEACGRLLDLGGEGRRRMGETGRQRMSAHFDVAAVAARYLQLYRDLRIT